MMGSKSGYIYLKTSFKCPMNGTKKRKRCAKVGRPLGTVNEESSRPTKKKENKKAYRS